MNDENSVDERSRVIDKTLEKKGIGFDVSLSRRTTLMAIEFSVLLVSCSVISISWELRDAQAFLASVLVAVSLFLCNSLCGTYRRLVYIHHFARLVRSALAHGISGVALVLPHAVWFADVLPLAYLLTMVVMSYFVTNTLRPVLVELLRAGNRLDQRRAPGSSTSVS